MSELGVGQEVAGYRIVGVLGRGGMGVVYRGLDQRLGRGAAVKVIATGQAGDAAFRSRFLEESRAAAAIDHPNVLPVYAAGEEDGMLYLVTRLVDGPDLAGLLEHQGAMGIDRALDLVSQVGAALDAAHAGGLTHRDVKPANVLVTGEPGNGTEHCYLTDFGLAQRRDRRTRLTTTGQVIGTLDYIAPEQIEGGSVDGRADLYALAAMFYECVSGEPPFLRDSQPAQIYAHLNDPPPPLSEKAGEAPPALDPVVARALAKSPEDRYGTCAEFVAALQDRIAGVSSDPGRMPRRRESKTAVAATLPASSGGPRRKLVRNALAAGILAVVAIVVVVVVLLSGGGGDDGDTATAALQLSTEGVSLARAIGEDVSRLARSVEVAGPTSDLVTDLERASGEAGRLADRVEGETSPGDQAGDALLRGAHDLQASASLAGAVAAAPTAAGAGGKAGGAKRSMSAALLEIERALGALHTDFVADGAAEAAESVEQSLVSLRASRTQLTAPFVALIDSL